MKNYILYIGLFLLWAYCLLAIFFSKYTISSLALFVLVAAYVYLGTFMFLRLDNAYSTYGTVPIPQKESVSEKILRFAITIGFHLFMGFMLYEHSILETGSGDKNFATQIAHLVLCLLFSIGLPIWISYNDLSKK